MGRFVSRVLYLLWRDRDFFFQAEDGIRDLTVTGVQTCALPISQIEASLTDYRIRAVTKGKEAMGEVQIELEHSGGKIRGRGRSEERRVGKEWRSRWSRGH